MIRNQRARKYKRYWNDKQLKEWLIKNPKCPTGGRKPLPFVWYMREMTKEDAEALALACCQVLLQESKITHKNRQIILRVPFDFMKTQKVLTHGNILDYDETGWWCRIEFNVTKVLQRLKKAGLISLDYKTFLSAKREALATLKGIVSELDAFTPESVYQDLENMVVNFKEKEDEQDPSV